ncbi:MAG: rhomboid family intramembrane serine protease [Candidatus Aenigmatarchaeota archaeon]
MNLTFLLIALMTIIFVLEEPLDLIENFSFIPRFAFYKPWTFLTSIFLHANFSHLFYNMLALFFFGLYLERIVDRKTYFLIFLISGIFGNIFFMLTTFNPNIPAVGASGAIYGIIGALAALRPYAIVYIYFTPLPLIVAAFLWALISFLGIFIPSSIAHAAHLSGLLTGYIIGYFLKRKERKRYFMIYKTRRIF